MQEEDLIIPLGAEAIYEGFTVQINRYDEKSKLYLVSDEEGLQYYCFREELSGVLW